VIDPQRMAELRAELDDVLDTVTDRFEDFFTGKPEDIDGLAGAGLALANLGVGLALIAYAAKQEVKVEAKET
jgi:hypothetical protein